MIKNLLYVFMGLGILVFSGCKKVEGPGGESTIKGTLMLKVYDVDYKVLQRIVPAADENVYITFGNNDYVGDKVVSGADGSFRFDYLQAGTYKIVVYSEDSIGSMDKKASVIKVVTLGDSKTVVLDTMYKMKTVNFDQGYASVSGRIWTINWTRYYIDIIDTSYATERDVYLIYGDHKVFDQRYRTNYDGMYEFDNLIVGDYTMFVYSEDIYGAPQLHTLKYKFKVNNQNQVVDTLNNAISFIPDFYINLVHKP
jgi:hypothetical protein